MQQFSKEFIDQFPQDFNFQYFISLKSFQARLSYCKEHLEYITSGSSRSVFKINDKWAIKVAKNFKGLAQNEEEYELSNDYVAQSLDILAPVGESDDIMYRWITMRYAKKCLTKDFGKITGVSFNDLCKALTKQFSKYKVDLEINEDIYENEFYSSLVDLIANFPLPYNEFTRLSTFGIIDNKVYIIDFGCSEDVFEKYYKRK